MTEKFKILKIVVFICAVFTIIGVLSVMVNPDNTGAGVDKFDKVVIDADSENENSIDIVVIGDSEAYRSIIPPEMYRKYGFTSYVAASPAQKTYQSYDMLEAILERQKPSVCILEPNVLFRDYSIVSSVWPRFEKTFPIFKYHNAWKGVFDSDYKYDDLSFDSFKGYRYIDSVKATKNVNYMVQTDSTEPISTSNINDFRRIYELCEKNDIKLLLLRTPSIKNWNYAKYDAVRQLAEKYKVKFIDLNMDNSIGIDWTQDTYDKGDHLNFSGAEKVTNFLGAYLDKRYDLPDHRGDKEYASWEKSVEKYLQKID